MIRPQKETRQSARLTTLRMSVAQAKDSREREGLHAIRSAFGTVIYYYCVSHRNYAVKAFAFSFSLALLKQVFSVDSPSGEQTGAKTSFRLRAPYG
jgi:hypothetical protein